MADERYRRTDGAGQGAARAEPASDPLVELARLIGQSEPAYEPPRTRRLEPPQLRETQPREPVAPPVSSTPSRLTSISERIAARRAAEAEQRAADLRDTEPPFSAPAAYDRQPEPRYSGYTEPPRPADAPSVDAALGRLAAPASDIDDRASEYGWRPPRPRQEPPMVHGRYATPAADDRFAAPEPSVPARRDPIDLAAQSDTAIGYDPRYTPAADGAYEAGEYAEPEQGYDHGYDPTAGDPYAPMDSYRDERPSSPRKRMMVAVAILALAVVGTAGAYGIRGMKGTTTVDGAPPVIRADTAPKKIASAAQGSGEKQLYDRVGDRNQNERVVPREEQPVAVRAPTGSTAGFPDATANVPPTISAPATVPAAGPAAAAGPKSIRTVTIRPDGEQNPPAPAAARTAQPAPAAPAPAARAARPAGNEPMSIAPQAAQPAPAARAAPQTAMVTPAPAAAPQAGGYVVQLAAQKTPEEARASFRAMQQKYPSVLGSRDVLVRKKDLGAKGVFYGSQVGPFASRDDAVQLCEDLKAAGGNCIVQRN